MKSRWTTTLVCLLLTLLCLPVGAATPEHVFVGEYDWINGGKGALTAEFSASSEQQWTVRFVFEFDGKQEVWNGTAEGVLQDNSEIMGTATWRNRNWSFSASIEDGTMIGDHRELKSRGRSVATGTFEINRQTP